MAIKLRTGQIGLEQRAAALAMFNKLVAESFTVLPVTGGQFRAAAKFADQHALGLRAGDALHLAVGLAFLSHLTSFYRDTSPRQFAPVRGGLAPWQQRRAKEMLLAHMDGRIGLDELAAACRLSRSHFARAFKASNGRSPLQWLLLQRIEAAKLLLLGPPLPLDQIADRCGFGDQSHFTRAFLRMVGLSPGQWRRIRRA